MKAVFRIIKHLPVVLLFAFPFTLQAQLNCQDFRTGVFYSYPKNTNDRSVSIVANDMQTEIDLVKKDTSVWAVEWKKDCSYILQYVSGGRTFPPEQQAFVKKHKVFVEIEATSPDYYVYAAYIDKKSHIPLLKDTMWLHEKAVIPNNELFKPCPTVVIPKEDHFSDTSKYALLYVWRPGKFLLSGSGFLVFFDDYPMWFARNNSGYLFKILKEGTHKLSSRFYNDEASQQINIQFGKVYYMKMKDNWGIQKNLNNFKLEIEAVPAATGQLEFGEVKYR